MVPYSKKLSEGTCSDIKQKRTKSKRPVRKLEHIPTNHFENIFGRLKLRGPHVIEKESSPRYSNSGTPHPNSIAHRPSDTTSLNPILEAYLPVMNTSPNMSEPMSPFVDWLPDEHPISRSSSMSRSSFSSTELISVSGASFDTNGGSYGHTTDYIDATSLPSGTSQFIDTNGGSSDHNNSVTTFNNYQHAMYLDSEIFTQNEGSLANDRHLGSNFAMGTYSINVPDFSDNERELMHFGMSTYSPYLSSSILALNHGDNWNPMYSPGPIITNSTEQLEIDPHFRPRML